MQTPKGGISAGTAVLWRKHVQVTQTYKDFPGSAAGRCTGIEIFLPGVGPTTVASDYGYVGNVQSTNHLTKQIVSKCLDSFVLIGDFNRSVEESTNETLLYHRFCQVQAWGSTCSTYNSVSDVDHAIISKNSMRLLKNTWSDDSMLATHRPITMELHTKSGNIRVRTINRTPRTVFHPPHGPHQSFSELWERWQTRWKQYIASLYNPDQYIQLDKGQWANFDRLWAEWNSLANDELAANIGLSGPAGEPFRIETKTLKDVTAKQRPIRYRRREVLSWIVRRIREGTAAARAKSAPQGYKGKGWRGWANSLRHKLEPLRQEGLIKDHKFCTCMVLTQLQTEDAFLQACENMAEYATSAAESEQKKWRKMQRDDYREKQAKDITIGNARAHNLTKPHTYAPPIAVESARGASTMPSDILADQERIWNKWWEAEQPGCITENPHWDMQGTPRQPIATDELRDAAKSFSASTSRSDGWQPKQIACLGDEGIRALADMLYLAERAGNLPLACSRAWWC